MPQAKETAILIFSRTAREEAAGERYGHSYRQNTRIAHQLIAHTDRAARLSGLPVIRKFSDSQQGLSFGERLANAIDSVFAQGFSRVITIGTDTPGITAGILRIIDRQLRAETLVIGPSADGGVYAIGISRDGWDRDAFLKVKWQTEAVQEDLSAYSLALRLTHCTLAPLCDIDNAAAFSEWLNHAGQHVHIARRIAVELSVGNSDYEIAEVILPAPAFPREAHRGPPVAA